MARDYTNKTVAMATLEVVKRGANVRGTRATFIRDNPRFVNEPIQRLLPGEDGGVDVASCLHWQSNDEASPVTTRVRNGMSTSHKDHYTAHNIVTPSHVKEQFNSRTVATLINPTLRNGGHYMEVISYNHQYNCRRDPNQPIRGKLHGALILKNMSPSSPMATITHSNS